MGTSSFPRRVSQRTAEQEARLTPKTTKKRAALADINTIIEPADKEAGEKPRKKNRGSKEKENKTPEETGVILQLEEFDEQQKTTQADEMCQDLKLIVNKDRAVNASISIEYFKKAAKK